MPNRPHNPNGTVRKRKDVKTNPWQAIVKFPDPDQPDRWKTQSQTFSRKSEAQAWCETTLASIRKTPNYRPPSEQTLADYLQYWLNTVMRGQVEDTTWQDYALMVRKSTALIGGKPLRAVTASDLQQMYSALAEQGNGPRTIRYVHTVIRHALADAVDFGLLATNPANKAKPPKLPRTVVHPPSADQAAAILAVADHDRLRALWYFLALTGCRRGEALGLRWDDIDWQRKIVTIQRNLVEKSGLGVVLHDFPKTSAGRRTVALSSFLIDVLKTHQAQQVVIRQAAGDRWQEGGWVFPTDRGTWIRPGNCNRQLKRMLTRSGLPDRLHPHELRHYMATQWIAAGQPIKVVSERLGHANIQITMQIYGHLLPNMQADAAEGMDQKLAGSVTYPSPGT